MSGHDAVAPGLAGRLVAGGHELLQRVYFEDTDFTGRVYHGRYLNFMERGRSDYLRLLGIRHRALADEGLAFVVHRMEIDFKGPARIDDVLTIRTVPIAARARIVLGQTVLLEGAALVEAVVSVVVVGETGRAVRLPAPIRAAFEGSRESLSRDPS